MMGHVLAVEMRDDGYLGICYTVRSTFVNV